MSEVSLDWKNKSLALRASGPTSYRWVDPAGSGLNHAREMINLSGRPLTRHSNVLVIGDGIDALTAMAASSDVLCDKIRLVYIDPPFNTNADVQCYSDSMDRSMWLSLLRDRLVALQPHLSDDASLWIHLDDSEVHRARLVLDEIFGEKAFVSSVVWQKRTTRDSRAAFSINHDTILVYAPSGSRRWKASRNLLPKNAAVLQNRDDDPRGPWADAPFTAPGYRAAQQYEIETPSGHTLTPPRGRSWYATEPTYRHLMQQNRIWFPKNGSGSPRIKLFSDELKGLVPFTIWESQETGTNDDAKRHLQSLFPEKDLFDTPKPEELLARIIHIASGPGELVVDLFGGSGTTAAVAHKMRRRWILVERNIETVSEFTLPRLQTVISGSDSDGVTEATNWNGGGSFELAYAPPSFGKAFTTEVLSEVKRLYAGSNTGPGRASSTPPPSAARR